jgi:putative peptidoglycan lipid II flippase
VIFPQLAVHAARKDWRELSDDLTLGLQIVLAVAVPASAGLVLLSEPITAALFEGGHFGADDARRTAWAVAAYSAGVWSYIAVMLLQRGYYALGDRRGPLFNALVSVVLNAGLNLLFVWPLGEAGIALSTALCGFCHLALLLGQLRRHDVAIPWRRLASTGLRTLAASAAMGAVAWFALQRVDAGGGSGRLLRLAIPFASGSAAFLAAAWLLRIKEFWLLFQIAARQSEPGS